MRDDDDRKETATATSRPRRAIGAADAGPDTGPVRWRLSICVNYRAGNVLPSCGARGGRELADALEAGIAARGIAIDFERLHCMGKCHIGPTMRLSPGGPFVMGAQESDVAEILDRLQADDIEALAAAFPLREEDRNIED